MSYLNFPIENLSTEKKLFITESLAFMGLAYIAGSKRFIQYFPGMSRSGFFMTAGFTCLNSSLYEVYKSGDESSESLWNFMKKTTVIAASIFMSFGFYKAYTYCSDVNLTLHKKISLSAKSSVRLGLFQLGLSLPYELWRSIHKQERLYKKIAGQRKDRTGFLRDFLVNHPLVIQSSILIGSAYMAGSKRCIQYFPNTSRLGLLVQGGVVFSANSFCEKFEDKSYPTLNVINKVCVLGLSVFYSVILVNTYDLISKFNPNLRNNISLSFNSNLKFGTLALAIFGSIHGMVYLSRQAGASLDEKPIDPKDILRLSDEEIRRLRTEALVKAVPNGKVNLVDPSVVGFLTVEQLDHLTDKAKRQALPQNQVSFIASFQEVMGVSKEFWPEMQLTVEVLQKLGVGEGSRVDAIFKLKDNLQAELTNVFNCFGASTARLMAAYTQITRILMNNEGQTGFEDGATVKGKEERQAILYDITHVIFALKNLIAKKPTDDEKATINLLLEGFVGTIANNYCKTGWTSALEQFEGIKIDHCNCCDCDKKDEENNILLKAKLEQKMALFKKECFRNTVLEAYGGRDAQQVHTVEWYARELPHLNVGARFSDLNHGCARQTISAQTIEANFRKKYSEEITPFLKKLVGYQGGDDEIRELVIDIFKGLFMEEARKEGVNLSKDQASFLVTSFIWDPYTYETNDAFVGILLYAFQHVHFDPLDPRFNQGCSNEKLFSINFGKVDVVLNRLTTGSRIPHHRDRKPVAVRRY